MALYSTLASLSQTAASNAADGSVDAPSTIDQQTNLLASFIAQLRDGMGHQVFTSSGTFNVPAGVTRVKYRVWGGGGGGGGAAVAANSAASGGGGGGYSEGVATVTAGGTVTITVGAAGTGGLAATPANGVAGGLSSFGAIATATGGGGGLAANGAVQATAGAGGVGTGGALLVSGLPGTSASPATVGYNLSLGGAAFCSSPSTFISASGAQFGVTGVMPGVGGGGGYLGGNGAPGAAGLVVVEW